LRRDTHMFRRDTHMLRRDTHVEKRHTHVEKRHTHVEKRHTRHPPLGPSGRYSDCANPSAGVTELTFVQNYRASFF
jgi:hypothetical protein